MGCLPTPLLKMVSNSREVTYAIKSKADVAPHIVVKWRRSWIRTIYDLTLKRICQT